MKQYEKKESNGTKEVHIWFPGAEVSQEISRYSD